MLLMNGGEIVHAEHGAFVFEGTVLADGYTYSRGNFISKDKMIKSTSKCSMLKFTDILGLKFHEERISCVNEGDE